MYIGIGTVVLIVIIVLVVLMLRRLCYGAAPAILIRRMSKSHDGRGYMNRPDRQPRADTPTGPIRKPGPGPPFRFLRPVRFLRPGAGSGSNDRRILWLFGYGS
jgi:hypothetical protein